MKICARARARAIVAHVHRVARAESGQSLVITILAMLLLLALTAFVIDIGALQLARHRAQVAADAAALAGAHYAEENSGATLAQIKSSNGVGTIAQDNDPAINNPGGSVQISQPASDEVEAQVTTQMSLPFASVFGLGTGTVSATSVAQDESQFCTNTDPTKCPTGTYVVDGDINAKGCAAATQGSFCEYFINCPGGTAYCPDALYPAGQGYDTPTIGASPGWTVTNVPEAADSSNDQGPSSVDLQDCTGATSGGTCGGSGIDCNISNSTLVVDLNGATEGGMWQTVQTVPGAEYKLSFCVTANPHGYTQNAQTAYNDYSTFTGDVQITDNGQRTLNCPAVLGPTNADKTAGIYDTSSTSCECPSNAPSSVLACDPISVTNQWPNGVSGAEQAEFEEESLNFKAQTSATTITFNSSTWGNNQTPWMYFGPEIASMKLEYPADALVQ